MTAWATLLIPAGALAVGGVITGGAAIWSQTITHRGTHKREREARRDTFMVKRHEIERDTLIALQDAVQKHLWVWIQLAKGAPFDAESTPANGLDLLHSVTLASQLVSRVLDLDARVSVLAYLRISQEAVGPQADAQLDAVTTAHAVAQNALGEALRRDPFADGA